MANCSPETVLLFPGQGVLPAQAGLRDVQAQMQVFEASLRNLRHWRAQSQICAIGAVAGHSMGLYAALVCAQALDETAARAWLLAVEEHIDTHLRRPHPERQYAMAFVIGFLESEMTALLNPGAFIACLNTQRQMVLAGEQAAVDAVLDSTSKQGALAAERLAISSPFHTPLMQPVSQSLHDVLDRLPLCDPQVPVVNVATGELLTTAAGIRAYLGEFLHCPQRWERSMKSCIEQGLNRFTDMGPGDALGRMMRWIQR